MKIAIIGATGYVGSKLLAEALNRGHDITAIVKDVESLPFHSALTASDADATDCSKLAVVLGGHDLVISAFNPGADEDGSGTLAIIDAVKRAGISRMLTVGGAGTLEIAPGKRVVDQPDFPAEWKEGALRTARFLDQLREETVLDWVFLSPAAMLLPGERTGSYRVGKDQLLSNEQGESRISLEDFAVAMLDEAEHPRHSRQRFTVAY